MVFRITKVLTMVISTGIAFICFCSSDWKVITPQDLTNTPPQFVMWYSDTSVVAGKPISLQLVAKDDDGDTIIYSSLSMPSGATLDSVTGAFYWKPDLSLATIGTHTCIFVVSDPDTSVSDTIRIDVSTGASPVFTCKDTVRANAGFTLSFQLKATDADNDILKYFVRTPTDTTMTIDSLSGLLRWTSPVALINTTQMCIVYATDGLTEDTLNLKIMLLAPSKIQVPATYRKIQTAIDNARSGDTIIVDSGTYSENISFKGKLLILGSRYLENGDTACITKTIIDGQSKAPVVMIASDEPAGTRICGFTIQKGRGNGNQGGGIHVVRCPLLVDHCIIKDGRSEGG